MTLHPCELRSYVSLSIFSGDGHVMTDSPTASAWLPGTIMNGPSSSVMSVSATLAISVQGLSEEAVRLAQKMQAGPCIPA
jgi:hypothetical protein